jgi:serine-type D-Ala-D-Ala carboxypeptidase/endopeptidase (penicillin-binding protein 4)
MGLYLSRILYSFFVLFLLINACGQTADHNPARPPVAVLTPVTLPDLQKAVTETAEEDLLRTGNWAFSLRSARTGEQVIEYNTQKSMVIASNMKLVTTATALAMLGSDFTFQTELQHDGNLSAEGTLTGNLYIRGGGDPTLGSNRIKGSLNIPALMTLWAEQISQSGIKRITGAIIGDADIYNDNAIPSGWNWADIGNYYGAPALGLNVNDNEYQLVFKPGATAGTPTRILRTDPVLPDLEFVNEVMTGPVGSGDNAYIYGAPYTGLRYVQGTVPAGVSQFVIKGAIPDPAQATAELLRKRLIQKGISVNGPATTTRLLRLQKKSVNTNRQTIYTFSSPPLKDIATETNEASMNLYAEALLKMIGYTALKEGTTYSGTKAITEFWGGNGVSTDGFFMRDGSGLSRSNAISASGITHMLHWCTSQPFFEDFHQSIPVVGVSGTVKNLGRGTAAAGKLRAKSGSVERVLSYSGYFRTQSGELMSFAMIANDYTGSSLAIRKKMESLMGMMAKLP